MLQGREKKEKSSVNLMRIIVQNRACKIKSGVTKNTFSYLKKTPRESIFNHMSLRKQNEKRNTSRYKKCS